MSATVKIASADKSQTNAGMTFFVCFLAALAGLLFGLDIGVIAGALPFIADSFHITSSQQEWVVSSMMFGATFLTMLNSLGSASTFWVYAALNVVFIFITLALIPETKNISLEHIERNLMAGKPLRKIGTR